MYVTADSLQINMSTFHITLQTNFGCTWPDLPKEVLCTHNFKTHLSSPFVSFINWATAHIFNTAEGWTVCFCSGLFLKPVWCPRVLGWPSNGPILPWQVDSRLWITTWLADKFFHEFSCFVWYLDVKMAPMEAIWLFSEDVSFTCHIMVPRPPPKLSPYRSANYIGYTS